MLQKECKDIMSSQVNVLKPDRTAEQKGIVYQKYEEGWKYVKYPTKHRDLI